MSNELSDKLVDLALWLQSPQGKLALRQPNIMENLGAIQKLLHNDAIDKPSKIPAQGVKLINRLLEQKKSFEAQYESLQKNLEAQCSRLHEEYPKLAQLLAAKGRLDPQQAIALFDLITAK